MVGLRHEARVLASLLAPLDVGVDGSALNRPRANESDLDGQIVEVLGPRLQEALHLRTALDLKDAHGVRTLDLLVDRRLVERDAREIDHLPSGARDLVDAVLDG